MLSIFLTLTVKKIAIIIGHIDKPNNNNIHKQSTPVGAGIAIILVFTSYLLISDIKSDQILRNFLDYQNLSR